MLAAEIVWEMETSIAYILGLSSPTENEEERTSRTSFCVSCKVSFFLPANGEKKIISVNPNKSRTFAIVNINDMETQVAYKTPLKPTATRTRKGASSSGARRADSIPEGYISLDEFGNIFHRKLDEAYAKLHGDSEQ